MAERGRDSVKECAKKVVLIRASNYSRFMHWLDVRKAHVDQWLVLEAIEARSEDGHRLIEQVEVIDVCPDGRSAMKRYAEAQRLRPHQEVLFAHTSNEILALEERVWIGVRGFHAANASR